MALTAEQKAASRVARWNALSPEQQRKLMDKRNRRDQLRKLVEQMRQEERRRLEERLAVEVAKATGRGPEVEIAQALLRTFIAATDRTIAANRDAVLRDRYVGIPAWSPRIREVLLALPHCIEREALEFVLRLADHFIRPQSEAVNAALNANAMAAREAALNPPRPMTVEEALKIDAEREQAKRVAGFRTIR